MYFWQDEYIAALAETDPAKQRGPVYEAQAAMEQRRLVQSSLEVSNIRLSNARRETLRFSKTACKKCNDSDRLALLACCRNSCPGRCPNASRSRSLEYGLPPRSQARRVVTLTRPPVAAPFRAFP
jgi:hypothetical protein